MVDIALIAHDQPPTVVHPAKTSLDLPALAVAGADAKRPPPFGSPLVAARKRWNGRLDSSPSQLLAKRLAVIGLIRHQLARPRAWTAAAAGDFDRHQSGLGERAFMRACARHMQANGQAVAIGDNHDFRALTDFGLADAGAPFFAGTKLPSKNACAQSNLPWASSWLNSARHIRSQVPSWDYALKRR
jgi:hypothetical protein